MFDNKELIEHLDGLRRFAYHLTHNIPDAEDLTQATILRALEKKDMFRQDADSNLFGWASKIMFNIFISQYRRRTRHETQYDPAPFIEQQSVNASQEAWTDVVIVKNAIDRLGKNHKDIISMICIDGLEYNEAAKILSVPVGTVRSRLCRARMNLGEALKKPNRKHSAMLSKV